MNRHLTYSLILTTMFVLTACGGSKGETPQEEIEVKVPPERFSLVFPSNNSVCQEGDLLANQPAKLGITLKWQKSAHATSYELSLTDVETGIEVVNLKTNDTEAATILKKATLYQWKITAFNNDGEKESAQWSFYTKGDGLGNYVPYPAYDFGFTTDTANDLLTITWKASDEDGGPITFDVKVFENDTEIMALSNLLENTLSDIDITIGATYQFLVTVKDGISETTTMSPSFTYN